VNSLRRRGNLTNFVVQSKDSTVRSGAGASNAEVAYARK
jgi:hypothetical protein